MYGLLDKVVEVGEYVFGQSKVPKIPYQSDGNWEQYLPKYEPQAEKFESAGCAVFGGLNQIETLYKRLYGEEPNYSDAFTFRLAGLKPGSGANPHTVYEAIREHGLVDQAVFPFPNSAKELMETPITGSMKAKGLNWAYTHDFMHEWLWTNRPENWRQVLREALQTSPIAVSVKAWRKVDNLYVSDRGGSAHWCLLYKIDQDGHMYVFDTYDHSRKILHPEHVIRRAKRIWINRKDPKYQKKHITLLQSIVNMLTNKKNLLDLCYAQLGKDASPLDSAPDSLACVDTVTTLLRQVYPEVPHMLSTIKWNDWLKDPKNGYVEIWEPEPEAIIVSPTVGKKTGHTGIFLNGNVIASNNSKTGRFEINYDPMTWYNYFHLGHGLTIHMYKRVR